MWVRSQKSSLFLFTCLYVTTALPCTCQEQVQPFLKVRISHPGWGEQLLAYENQRGFVCSLGFAGSPLPSCMSHACPFQFTSSWIERGELGSPISCEWEEPTFSLWLAANHLKITSWMFVIKHVCERERLGEECWVGYTCQEGGGNTAMFSIGLVCILNHCLVALGIKHLCNKWVDCINVTQPIT